MQNFAINRPITTLMAALCVVFFGVLGLMKIKTAFLPEVDFPVVTIFTYYPGASAQIVENKVTDKIETATNSLEGVKRITSRSRKGLSLVIIEFNLEKNIDTALNDVNAKLASLGFAEGVRRPIVQKYDTNSEPILSLFVGTKQNSAPLDPKTRVDFEKNMMKNIELSILPELQKTSGVGGVDAFGLKTREIRVQVLPAALSAHKITFQQIASALSLSSINRGVGDLVANEKDFSLIFENTADDLDALLGIFIAPNVRLGDVAKISDGFARGDSFVGFTERADPKSASMGFDTGVILEVRKIPKANEIQISDNVKTTIARLSQQFPELQFKIFLDNTDFIKEAISDVEFDLALGGLLAVLVVFLFLRNGGITLVSALSLPVSIFGTIAIIQALGYTLNMLSLVALTLSIGIIIDDAIVVIENIHKKIEQGMKRRDAAIVGAREISFSIVAISAMLLCVFVPIGTMDGIIGRFFESFGISIAVAIAVSYFVVLTLIPMASSIFISQNHSRFYVFTAPFFAAMERRYVQILKFFLRFKFLTFLGVCGIFVASIFVAKSVGIEFLPQEDNGKFYVYAKGEAGVSTDFMREKMLEIQHEILKNPAIKFISAQNGFSSRGANEGRFYVQLTDPKNRPPQKNVMRTLNTALKNLKIPQMTISVGRVGVAGVSNKSAFEMSLFSADSAALYKSAQNLENLINTHPLLKNRVTNFYIGKNDVQNELRISLDKIAANRYGISPYDVANTLTNAFARGNTVANFRPSIEVAGKDGAREKISSGKEYDITLQVPSEILNNDAILLIKQLQVRNKFGHYMFLDGLVKISETESVSSISRYNRQANIRIYADPTDGLTLGELTKIIQENPSWRESGVTLALQGDSQNTAEVVKSFVAAIMIAIVMIFFVLASLYESLVMPFVIMITMPLSFMGAFFSLKISSNSFSLLSFMGLMLLLGMVGKNATLLLDVAIKRRRDADPKQPKISPYDAIIFAAQNRLRPILMTTIAMIFGMLPLALSAGSTGESLKTPIGIPMIGGLLCSMVLSLIVVPIFYVALAKIDDKIRRLYEK